MCRRIILYPTKKLDVPSLEMNMYTFRSKLGLFVMKCCGSVLVTILSYADPKLLLSAYIFNEILF